MLADPSSPEHWSGANKLSVMTEAALLKEGELSASSLRKGLYAEKFAHLREAEAHFSVEAESAVNPSNHVGRQDRTSVRGLTRGLSFVATEYADSTKQYALQTKQYLNLEICCLE